MKQQIEALIKEAEARSISLKAEIKTFTGIGFDLSKEYLEGKHNECRFFLSRLKEMVK